MMKKLMTVGCALVSVSAAFAEDIPAGHVYLTKSDHYATDSKHSSSWNVKGNWSDGAWIEESSCLNVNTNYYVPTGCYLYPEKDGSGQKPGAWLGGPMVVAGGIYTLSSTGYIANQPKFERGITFLSGSYFLGTWRYHGLVDTPVTILATRENPFDVMMSASKDYDGIADFPGSAFSGAAESGMRIYASASATRPITVTLREGNFTDFCGLLTVLNPKATATLVPKDGAFTFAGDVVVTNGATMVGANSATSWDTCATVVLNSLSVREDAAFKFWKASGEVRPFLDVKAGLSIDESARVTFGDSVYADFDYTTPERASSNKFLVANVESVGAVCALPEGPISNFWSSANASRLATDWAWVVEEDGNGGKNVFIAYTNNVVKAIKSDAAGSGNLKPEDTAFGTPHPEEYWSDGKMPSADSTADYVMSYGKILTVVNLPKATLTMRSGSDMYWNGSGALCVKELNLVDTGKLYRYTGGSPKVMPISGGKLNLIGSSDQSIYAGLGFGFAISSDITGMRALNIRAQGSADKYTSEVSLLGDNSGFHGRLNIVGAKHTTADSGAIKVYLADARNWGGAFTADADVDRAIVIKNLTQVFVTNDVAFVGENVRNMAVANSGVMFSVSTGKTLTLGNKITCDSEVEIRKSGAGTLEMSGSVALSPSVESSALKINAGALKVSSATAVDGLDVSFAAGTKLIVGKDCGFVNTAAANPLAIADEKLSVEIAGFDEKPEDDIEVTVLALNATAAAGIGTDRFAFTRTSACKIVKFEKRESGDNVEYVATVGGKKGIVLIVR